MRIYLDTSVLVALFLMDVHTEGARRVVGRGDDLLLSDFTAAEFSSAISGFHRVGRLDAESARIIFADFDAWSVYACTSVQLEPLDMRAGDQFMRRLELTLRTPDALHVAAAGRLRASLATFDVRMAEAARRLNVSVIDD